MACTQQVGSEVCESRCFVELVFYLSKCLAFFILVEFFCKFHQSPIILCLICWQFSPIYFLPPQEHIVHFYLMHIFHSNLCYNLHTNINFCQLNMFFKKMHFIVQNWEMNLFITTKNNKSSRIEIIRKLNDLS